MPDFGDSSLNFELRFFVGDVIRRLRIATDVRYGIDRRVREEGIEIPVPQRVLHMPSRTAPQPPIPDAETP